MNLIRVLSIIMIGSFFGCAVHSGTIDNQEISSASKNKVKAQFSLCESLDKIAEVTMTARQKGVPYSEMIRIAKQTPIEGEAKLSKGFKGINEAIVDDAYAQPRWSTEENRMESVQNFRNKVYGACRIEFKEQLQ